MYISVLTMQMLPVSPSFQENHDDMLELEMREEAGSFFSRLLSREETTGYSSRIYYRAPSLGRVPFNWEAEPGKPKTASSCYIKEELVDDNIIPPLSPPPFFPAKAYDNSRGFSSRKRRAGLLYKIMYFLQRSAKLIQMTRSPAAGITLSINAGNGRYEMKIKNDGTGIKNRLTSELDCGVNCAASETEDDDDDFMSDFSSHMSLGRLGTSSSSSNFEYNFF